MLSKTQIRYYQDLIYSKSGERVYISQILKTEPSPLWKYRISIMEEAMRLINTEYKLNIKENIRKGKHPEARHLFVYLIKKRINIPKIDSVIALFLGKDRTTIINSYQKASNWLKIYSELRAIEEKVSNQLDVFIQHKILENEQEI